MSNYFDNLKYFRYNENLTGCMLITKDYNEYSEYIDRIIIGYSFSNYDKLNKQAIEELIELSIEFSFKDKKDLIDSYISLGYSINNKDIFSQLKKYLTDDRDLKVNNINYILNLEFECNENCPRDLIAIGNYILEILDKLENIIK